MSDSSDPNLNPGADINPDAAPNPGANPKPGAGSGDDQPTEILFDTTSDAGQPQAWNLDDPVGDPALGYPYQDAYQNPYQDPQARDFEDAYHDAKRQIRWMSGAIAGLAALCLGLGFWGFHQSQENGGGFAAGFGHDHDGRFEEGRGMGPGGMGGMGQGGRIGGPRAERMIEGLFHSDGTVNSDAAAQFQAQAKSGAALSLDSMPSLMEHMVGEGRITQEQADALLKELGLGSTGV